jgi:hypothetical protein
MTDKTGTNYWDQYLTVQNDSLKYNKNFTTSGKKKKKSYLHLAKIQDRFSSTYSIIQWQVKQKF